MARVTGLTLRGAVYQLRTTIPTDLRDRFGRSCIRKSLGTADRQQAELKGSAERTRLLALFNAARQAPCKPIEELAVRTRVVEGIDFSLGTDLLAQPTSRPQPPRRKPKAPNPQTQPKKALPTLRQLYERWLQVKKRTKGCENSCLLAVQSSEKALGALPIDKITRAHGDTFRSWLLKQPMGGNRGIRDVLSDEDLILYSRCYDTAVALFRSGLSNVEKIQSILQAAFGARINPADYGLCIGEAV